MPLNPYSAKDAKSELQVYLYHLEREHKEIEVDDRILNTVLANKIYLRKQDHILLWIAFLLVYVSFLSFYYLIMGRNVIFSYTILAIIATTIICNLFIIERMFLSNRRIIMLMILVFIIFSILTNHIPNVKILVSPVFYILLIIILLGLGFLISSGIKQAYIRNKVSN